MRSYQIIPYVTLSRPPQINKVWFRIKAVPCLVICSYCQFSCFKEKSSYCCHLVVVFVSVDIIVVPQKTLILTITVLWVNKSKTRRARSANLNPKTAKQSTIQFMKLASNDANAKVTPNKNNRGRKPVRSPPTPLEIFHEKATNSKNQRK